MQCVTCGVKKRVAKGKLPAGWSLIGMGYGNGFEPQCPKCEKGYYIERAADPRNVGIRENLLNLAAGRSWTGS